MSKLIQWWKSQRKRVTTPNSSDPVSGDKILHIYVINGVNKEAKRRGILTDDIIRELAYPLVITCQHVRSYLSPSCPDSVFRFSVDKGYTALNPVRFLQLVRIVAGFENSELPPEKPLKDLEARAYAEKVKKVMNPDPDYESKREISFRNSKYFCMSISTFEKLRDIKNGTDDKPKPRRTYEEIHQTIERLDAAIEQICRLRSHSI
jgi:hypothetical protein